MGMNGCGVDDIPESVMKSIREQLERAIAIRDKAKEAKKLGTPVVGVPLEFLRDKPMNAVDRVIIGAQTLVFTFCPEPWMERGRDAETKNVAVLMPFAEYQELVALRKDVDDLAARNAAKPK